MKFHPFWFAVAALSGVNLVSTVETNNVNADESADIDENGTTIIPNSCAQLDDGYHWIKMIDGDDYTPVYQKCSNGYIVLDYTIDNNIQEYFNTWTMWHLNTAGPTNDVHINWEDWYLGNDGETSFLISPDCNTCQEGHKRQIHGQQTAYYMTGTLFGCFWAIKGAHNCDVDWETDICYTCSSSLTDQGNDRIEINDDSDEGDFSKTGICPHNVQSSSYWIAETHDDCTHELNMENHLEVKPSLGTNGQFCVCTKPTKLEYYEISNNQMPTQPNVIQEPLKLDPTTYYLKQENFKYGTYRITNPGTYVFTEDIVFNFNQDFDHLPTEDQADDYPGANDYRDPYFLGFFAGLTIECDNVVLDLNGHTLKMSEEFYYSQRWFTTISLTTQYFLPGQGIGNFGAQPKTAEKVTIKNGILGLTSHHGIHGNYNKQILIENIIVKNFETHGIQFNGFDGISLINVEIGPTSNKAFFNGEYGHMRLLLPRYKKIAEESFGETIKFHGRDDAVSMADIAEEIERQMKYAKDYVISGITIDENDENYESYLSGLKLFVNEDGIPNGGAQYGIFLNTFGASVFTYNLYTGYFSTNAHLENIKIHGMRHEMEEYVRLHRYKTGDIIINPFNAPLNLEEMFEDVNDLSNPKYKGNILIDAYIASNMFSDDFGYLGLQIILNDEIGKWAQGENWWDVMDVEQEGQIQIGCNSDVMIHSGKGINGLRLDGVSGVTIKNLEIYDIMDSSPVGKLTCGEYDDFSVTDGTNGGHFRQTQPMQIGFSGNMAQAINVNAAEDVIFENVEINGISSHTGPAFGFSIWPACDVKLKGDINVKNLKAGTEISKGTYEYTDRPNKAPETCAVRAYYEYSDYITTINYDEARFNTECISGHVGCLGSIEERTMLGESNNACSDESYDMMFMDVANNNNERIGEDEEEGENENGEMDGKDSLLVKVKGRKIKRLNSNIGFDYVPKQSTNNIIFEIFGLLCLVGLLAYYKYRNNLKQEYELVENYGTC